MNFRDFLVQDEVVNIFLGTIIAYGLTKFTESVEKNIIRPFIKKNVRITGKTKLGNIFSSFLELSIILVVVYLFYRFITKRNNVKNINNNTVVTPNKKDTPVKESGVLHKERVK